MCKLPNDSNVILLTCYLVDKLLMFTSIMLKICLKYCHIGQLFTKSCNGTFVLMTSLYETVLLTSKQMSTRHWLELCYHSFQYFHFAFKFNNKNTPNIFYNGYDVIFIFIIQSDQESTNSHSTHKTINVYTFVTK